MEYIKKAKMAAFSEDFLSQDDFEAVLVTLGCYHYGTNSSETVQKIATDRKDYHTSSLGYRKSSFHQSQ